MNVSKSNLVAMLLEVGEENAAVLLARSNLPDEIDLQRDLDFLTALGLDRDQVDEVAQLTIGSIESDDENGRRRRGEMETTISRRWAELTASPPTRAQRQNRTHFSPSAPVAGHQITLDQLRALLKD